MSTTTAKAAERQCNEFPIAVRLTTSELEQAREMAVAEQRSTANFVRQVYRIGLTHYLAGQTKAAPGAVAGAAS